MTKKSETFGQIIEHGVDIKNRRIYFGTISNGAEGGDFDWDSVEIVVRAIHMLSSTNKQPIELHMSSLGGSTYDMLRLYDTIQSCACQIKFFGSGNICSSASYIMAGCDERYITQNSQIMLHKWRGGVESSTETDVKIEMEHSKWLTDKLNSIYVKNSRMPFDFWEEVTKRDLYLTPEEAIQLGLADEIIPYKKRGNLRRKRMAKMSTIPDKKDMRQLINSINKRIHRGKNLKIELSIPDEQFDKDIIVEDITEDQIHQSFQKPNQSS